jgi:hypothetical protein
MQNEHRTTCPNCAFSCRIKEQHKGKRVACPKCKCAFIVPPPALIDYRYHDADLSRYALTVSELRNICRYLPDREVVIQFPYSTIKLSMQQVRDSLKGRVDDDFIYDQSTWHVISRAETIDGWLRLTFGWRYWVYYFENGKQLGNALPPPVLEQIDSTLGLAYAHYQNGLTLDNALHHLPLLTYVADVVSHRVKGNHCLARLLTDPVDLLRSAIDIWKIDPGYIHSRVVGGGFGIRAALNGMALASLANKIIDSQNRKTGESHMQRVELPLQYSFQQLRATQELVRSFPRIHGSQKTD